MGPYVSVGGLSQVLYFLPRALSKLSNQVVLFTPKFGAMDETVPNKKGWPFVMEVEGLHVPVKETPDKDDIICNIKSIQRSGSLVKTYFLENREYYELRANVFGYKDDHVRFMLLCKGALEWLRILKNKKDKSFWPDVIHCHDWHTAYFIELARRMPRYREMLAKIPVVLTVHNFTYQGNYEYKYCNPEDRDEGIDPLLGLLDSDMQKQNPLLRGIKYADAITTVSPTHAREVMTPEYGEGLDPWLREERDKVSGILNGLDTKEFDPAHDPLIARNYSKQKFVAERAVNKAELQELFELPKNPKAFLMAFSGRLVNQKGLNLLVEAMRHALEEREDWQFVVLGGGDDSYRRELGALAAKHPKKLGLHLLPNFKLPRKIFAGADSLIIPSLFEPGGIVALEALRYGAIPIVRRTGGLNDIVRDFDPSSGLGNGFAFIKKDGWSLYGAMVEASTTYKNPKLWKKLVTNALEDDFDWEQAAKSYHNWYIKVMAGRKRLVSKKPQLAYIDPLKVKKQ